MRNIPRFLDDLKRLDIVVRAEGTELKVDGPSEVLTDDLIEKLKGRKQDILSFLNRDKRNDSPEMIPLSFAQERLWFLHQLVSENPFYNIAAASHIEGALDPDLLERTFNEIVRRHEILRTVFISHDGIPKQRILEASPVTLSRVDLSHLAAGDQKRQVHNIVREATQVVFDLSRLPLFKVVLVRTGAQQFLLVITMHHMISDAWSMGVLNRETGRIYNAFAKGEPSPLKALPLQYADFAVRQHTPSVVELFDTQLDYWRGHLEGLSPLDFPTDHPRPPVPSYRGSRVSVCIPKDLTRGLKVLSRESGATLFMVLLAGFSALLSRYTGQRDIVLGSPIAGRTRRETEAMIGFFVNTLIMRTDLSGNPTFLELLTRVRETALGAYANQSVPFEQIVAALQPERDMSRNPLVQVSLALQNVPPEPLDMDGLRFQTADLDTVTVRMDIECYLWESGGEIHGTIQYCQDLFEPHSIERLSEHFVNLLRDALGNPGKRLSEFDMLSPGERQQILGAWSGISRDAAENRAIPCDCLHHLFEAQAEKHPDVTAVVSGKDRITYRRLSAIANGLAFALRSLGVGPESVVGLLADRSVEMVAGMLGILKAGGAYLPLDPELPEQRISFMIRDASVRVAVSRKLFMSRLPEGIEVVCVGGESFSLQSASRGPVPAPVSGANPAYVLYTSGSTGEPKGVVVSHGSAVNLLHGFEAVASSQGRPVGTAVCPFVFDVSVWEIFSNLCFGGTLHLLPAGVSMDPAALARYIQSNNVTSAYLPPGLLDDIAEQMERLEAVTCMARLLTGVEPIRQGVLDRFAGLSDALKIINGYGPAEACVCGTFYPFVTGGNPKANTPIGTPVAGYRIYIMDKEMNPVPAGVPGELAIGGKGLARGYLGHPGRTAEKFVPDPFGTPGGRLYKTGDMAKWLPDGNIAFLGRRDHQVKIRGFRIELGEIERALSDCPEVKAAAVIVHGTGGADKRLAAYIEPVDETEDLIGIINRRLKERLPGYMIPAAFTIVDGLPLTPSGKIDRNALPAPEFFQAREAYTPPSTRVEKLIASVWADVLGDGCGGSAVGRHDSFFELGGHSLLATQVITRINLALDARISVRDLFEHPTVHGLAGLCGETVTAAVNHGIPLISRESENIRLSFAQERLWFLEQLISENPFYNMAAVFAVEGTLDKKALHKTFNEIIRRHEVLRTAIVSENGVPVQRILPFCTMKLEFTDLSGLGDTRKNIELRTMGRSAVEKVFDLTAPPLFRADLFKTGPGQHILMITMHHIVSDGWSMGVMFREMGIIYNAMAAGRPSPLPELRAQYADFAAWQRRHLTGDLLEKQLDYWRGNLAGVLPLNLPLDRPRPSIASYRGGRVPLHLPADLTRALKRLSRESGASLFMTLLAGFTVLMARYSGQTDIAVGAPIAGRTHRETEALIGFFVNTLVMRTDLSGNLSFRDVLARVRKTALSAYAHQEIPFEQIVADLSPERDMSRNPIVQVAFAFQNAPMDMIKLDGLEVRPAEVDGATVRMDMEFHLWEADGGIAGYILYCTDLFEHHSVDRLAGHFRILLTQIAACPDKRIGDIDILGGRERRQLLVEWNDTAREHPPGDRFHHLFEACAQHAPDADAVVFGDDRVSYGELNRRANILAHHLRSAGVGPEVVVGIAMDRSIGMITGVLGVLKAGGAFLPLDMDLPEARIEFMIADSGTGIFLSQEHLAHRLPGAGHTLIYPEDILSGHGQETRGEINPEVMTDPDNAVYIIYTSGSTGVPKGVVNTQKGLVNLAGAQIRAFDLTAKSRVLQFATVSFDASVSEIAMALGAGATLCMGTKEMLMPGPGLMDVLDRYGITHVTLPPSALNVLSGHDHPEQFLPDLKTIVTAGEACAPDLASRWSENRRFFNAYGPTESSVCAAIWKYRPGALTLPIGQPIDNFQLYILDQQGEPLPIGVPGELHIGGRGLSRGYLGRPDLTAERYIPNPFGQPGERLYKTGDLAKWMPDGNIEFMGRMDHQVKIRGFRIELGEIEGVLSGLPAVEEAAVMVREADTGDKQLVAYVVSGPQSENEDRWRSGHLDQWQHLYESAYGDVSGDISRDGDAAVVTPSVSREIDFNIAGWNSSFSGRAIPEEEMREWVDNTADRILSLAPDRVLEIGCGTGLVLSRVAPFCSEYRATDFSGVALDHVRKILKEKSLSGQVRLFHRRADDFEGMAPESFDLVIINSVVQYFPDTAYLLDVIKGAVKTVRPGGTVFIGDVRDYSRLEAFHTATQTARADDSLDPDGLRRKIAERITQETELLISPSFFHGLGEQFSDVSRVETLHKKGRCHNEMTMFRYDVLLHINENAFPPSVIPTDIRWLDWKKDALTKEGVRRLMTKPGSGATGIRHLPNARTDKAFRIMDRLALSADTADGTNVAADISVGTLREEINASLVRGMDPQALWDMGDALGCQVMVRCSDVRHPDTFDLVFAAASAPPIITDRAPEEDMSAWTDHANNPLKGKLNAARISSLKADLRETLPDYMVPSRFMILDHMPLTPSGKINRKALPEPDSHRDPGGYLPPRTPVEEALASIWGGVLGLTDVGIRDNFFELGGHSLLATQVISRVNSQFDTALSVRELFEYSTVEAFAGLCNAEGGDEGDGEEAVDSLCAVKRDADRERLSFAQERLWFLDQLMSGNPFYNMVLALHMDGDLNRDLLADSFNEIIRRHETLRTGFYATRGIPAQRIHAACTIDLPLTDLSGIPEEQQDREIRDILRTATEEVFELSNPPLLRACLIRVGRARHILSVTMHHIISDGWSMGVFNRELSRIYTALLKDVRIPLAELPVQYADFAAWQRRRLTGERLDKQLDYWRRHLDGLLPLNLLTDKPRPSEASYRGDRVVFRIPEDLTSEIKALGREAGCSLFMTLLAGFSVLLSRYTGQSDIAVGSPIAGRTRTETESLIGFFVNTLVMRTDLSGAPTFRDVLGRVRKTALSAYAHQDLPFEQIVSELAPERDVSRNPLVQVVLALQNAPMDEMEIEGLSVRPAKYGYVTVRMDMEVHLWEFEGELLGSLLYCTDLFERDTVQRLADHFVHLLGDAAAHPDTIIEDLKLTDRCETQRLQAQWNDTGADYPLDTCIHHLFEAQAQAVPDAVAVAVDGEEVSYGELNLRGDILAGHLQALGVGPDDIVGVCMVRSPDMITGILGVLKAGAAYLPIDPDTPPERRAYMLADAGAGVVVTQNQRIDGIPQGCVVLPLEDAAQPLGRCVSSGRQVQPGNLAYVIYTSGSTGRPKGVGLAHRGLVNLSCWHRQKFGITGRDRASMVANAGFDASVWEVWPYLMAGARVMPVPSDIVLSPEGLQAWLISHGISISFLPTPLAEQLLKLKWADDTPLRSLLTGGDRLRYHPDKKLPFSVVNNYGPTENTVVTTSGTVRFDTLAGRLPDIGTPIDNTRVYILDAGLNLVPEGVPGELHISGEGLARGYLGRADLTAAQFIPDPFGRPGDRLYRTGDLVRQLADGRIEFLDRMDYQVKIRGFRIELGEIEAVLSDLPEVEEAAVAVGEEDSGAQCLVAYVVPGCDGENDGQWRSDHIDKWQHLYEETYGGGSAEPPPGASADFDAGFNITGWNSSFTGRAIPEEQMREWVDNTVDRILSLAPDRVLEIGCGTGLLLSRIAPSCSKYLATDFSQAALDNVRQIKKDRSSLGHVRLLRQEADDFEGLAKDAFDGVVLNSVVQYFPDVNYLAKVIEGALQVIRPGGFIFMGDVRDYSCLAVFHTAVQVARAKDTASLNLLRRQIGGKIARENELLLAPSFFSRLRQHFQQISRVETLHKQGQYHNELTMFRYDAVLHIEDDARPSDVQWLDWETEGLTLSDLRRLMAGSSTSTGIRHVPNARTEAAFRTENLLEQAADDAEATVGTLREQLRVEGTKGIDPQRLWDLGVELGCRVAVLCSESRRPDTFDVIFSSSREPIITDRVSDRLQEAGILGDFANNPLQGKVNTGRISDLQERLRKILPAYMIPSRFVILDGLPLTASGKIDRKALPGLDRNLFSQGYTPPKTPVQEILASVWAKVLGLPAVGIHDNFFELGGHSLLATQVISRVNTLMGVEVSVRDLFEGPTIEAFATGLQGRRTGKEEKIPVRSGETASIPMSFAQERLWFLDQLIQDTPLYNISMALNLKGELDSDAFSHAFREIVRRHEVLRTGFLSREGMPVQQPVADLEPQIVREDFTALTADLKETEIRRVILAETAYEFDLATPPLVRAVLMKIGKNHHILVLTMHHIVSDGWSMGVMNRELSAIYDAFSSGKPSPLPEPAIQYADFTCWQRHRFSGDLYETQLNYWKAQLSNVSVLNLHTDHVRPQVASGNGERVAVSIPAQLTRALKRVSRDADATLFMTLLAGFAVLLSRYTHQEDIAVGSPIANRTHTETESLIGCFINTLVLRTDLSGDPTFRDALGRVRKLALDAYAHQELPFEQLVAALQPERDMSRNPLVQVMFALQNAPMEALRFGGLEATPAAFEHVTVAMDMEVHLWEDGDEITGSLLYSVDLFEHRSMTQLVAHYLRLLEDAVENPDKPITDLALMDKAETYQLLTRWNETQRDYPRDKCLHHLFEAQALATPDAKALVFDDQAMTYRALNARANQLGHYLKGRGVGPEVLVGICADRSMDMIVGVLGILKAGGAYVPIDPEYPDQRKVFILQDTGTRILLTQEHLCRALPESRVHVFCLDRDWDVVAGEGTRNVAGGTGPANPVYGIYTSGTTGEPKGTLVSHTSLVNLITTQSETFGIDGTERILQFSSLSFDASAEQIWLALSTGATLVLVAKETLLDPVRFHDYMLRHRITHLDAVPSFLNAFDFQKSHHIRRILASAEACPKALARKLSRNVDFYNVYGLTETGVTSVVYKVDPDELPPGRLPIGRPIANTRAYILDRRLKPVPVGVPGELYIGGAGLAREYLNRPELTESGFIPSPFDGEAGSRLYKTGDLCRYLPQGHIEFLGRVDHQVKIRGFRVEPGEIESQLRGCDGVDDAVVLPREDKFGSMQLAAYLVPEAGAKTPSPQDIQAFLKAKLPGYMVPSAFALLDALPLNPNGKIDRNALPEPDTIGGQDDFSAPRGNTGKALARIWERVLNLEQVGVHDNFFDIGGNSLLLMKVMAEIKETLGRKIPVIRLFEHPTIDSLCRFLDGGAGDSEDSSDLRYTRRGRAGDAGGAKDIAIVGMAGRFPGAPDIHRFWENLKAGVESIAFFTDRELLDAGVDPEMLGHPDYVRAGGVIPDIEMFDAAFFDFSPKEASVTDPQNRLFLECAWEALETAGYNPRNCGVPVGVYAGKSMDGYFLENLYGNPDILKTAGGYQISISNGAEFLATQASYKLDLTGPSIGVQTACSTSLVAVHMAVQSILAGECHMALAGGASVAPAQTRGYLYQKDMIASPDGHCRAFDADARGTVRGNGVGVVVLKPLADAVSDGDTVYAIIKGSAVNNDGRGKIGFTAPSIEGQASVIADAQAAAGIAPETLRFIEAHGTGTNLGDPVEIAALTRAFRITTGKKGFCAVGSLKTNIGHLDAAAGVAGLIKTALSLHHRKLPPSLHYKTPNPDIDFDDSPFYVNDKLDALNTGGETPLRAGVSSFGIGGTNAHMVLEEAPQAETQAASLDFNLLMLSAKTGDALDTMIENLALYLDQHPDIHLPDVAYTLCVGREVFDHRAFIVCRDTAEAVEKLRSSNALFRGHAGAGVSFSSEEPVDIDSGPGLEALGERWLKGEEFHGRTLFGDQSFKRVPLPTYPFERRRHWVDRPGRPAESSDKTVESTGKKTDIADWFYRPVWVPRDKAKDFPMEKTTCLVFTDPWGLGDGLTKMLSDSGKSIVTVHAGDAFSRQSDGVYTIDPREPDHYEQLMRGLHASVGVPGQMVHLWSITPGGEENGTAIEDTGLNLDRTFHSLLHIARALGVLKGVNQVDLAVVSNTMQAVTDHEVVLPEKSALLGPVRTIGLEYPHISCRSIDLGPDVLGKRQELHPVVAYLAEELAVASGDQVVALRDGERYVQTFTPVRIDDANGKTPVLRDHGVYLITGGLGGIGLTLANHLAESIQAKLVLVGQSAFPRKNEWGHWLDTHGENDRISRKIRSITAMEEKGAQVLVANADVADLQRMKLVVLTAQKHFGAINGVIHCAGAPDGALIPRRTQALTDSVLAPKIAGTRVLERVLENIDMDFFLLCSSLSSVSGAAGQVAYCTANAFLDAFANTGNKKNGCAVVAVNWDTWQDVGMAADSAKGLSATVSGPETENSTPVDHPLLTERIDDYPEKKQFVSRLDTGTHWVLDEHRLADDHAVLPGTACLEMAAAAFRDCDGSGAVEIREVYFLRPMVVKENDVAELHTTLKAKDGGFDFTIESRDVAGGWVAHAKGWIGGVTHPAPGQRDIKALENHCTNTPEIELSALQTAIEERYGPRWHSLQWVKAGNGQGLARLKLEAVYRSELADYLLHPGLLDIGTSFLSMMDPALEGLPFSYKRLVVSGPLTGDLYSHAKLTASKSGGPCFDITIMDEHGVELVEIESYRLRPLGDGALKDTPVGSIGSSPVMRQKKDAPLNGGTGINLKSGILPSEGIEVFNRILAHALTTGASQVLVSTTGNEFLPGHGNPSQKTASRSGTTAMAVSEVEPVLTAIWQEFLGVEEVTNLDNFFELGGDSLAGIQIATEIEERLGVSIAASALLEMPTILELAEHIRDLLGEKISQPSSKTATPALKEMDNSPEMVTAQAGRIASPLVRIAPETTVSPFFCVHPVSGTVFCYRNLAAGLDTARPFYALQSSGINAGDDIFTRAEDMAAYYLASIRSVQKEGPYYIGGWSMGGLVAFEMARQLTDAGHSVAVLMMIDTYLPALMLDMEENSGQKGDDLFLMINDLENLLGKPIPIKSYELKSYEGEARVAYALNRILEMGVMPSGTDYPQMKRYYEVLKANSLAMENYRPEVYNGETVFFSSIEKMMAPGDPGLGWGEFVADDKFRVEQIPGNHYSMLQHPNVSVLADAMTLAFQRIGGRRQPAGALDGDLK